MRKNNPWKGLVSYEEKDVETYEFCGRTKAIGKFYSLVTNNLVTTLYGRTGCGKTSLLQAGLFPLLRKESFLPVMCRLSQRSTKDAFYNYIKIRVQQEICSHNFNTKDTSYVVEHVESDEKNPLWQYFYGHHFTDENEQEVFPVIVLDQFEEILISSKDEAFILLEQLSVLVGDELLLSDDVYSNFRIVISLREDFLYLLEDAIDNCNCSMLRDNRMRLLSMDYEEARDVIALGHKFIKTEDIASIEESILQMSMDKRDNISTNMLSLICSQLFHVYDNRSDGSKITAADVKNMKDDPLDNFYRNSIKGLKKKTIEYIEAHFVSNNLRRPVMMHEFTANVNTDDCKQLLSGDKKLLQRMIAGDHECVELLHDTLARTVSRISEERKRETHSIIRKWLIGLLCIIIATLTGCFIMMKHETQKEIISANAKVDSAIVLKKQAETDLQKTELDYLLLNIARDTTCLNVVSKEISDSIFQTSSNIQISKIKGYIAKNTIFDLLSTRELSNEDIDILKTYDKKSLEILRCSIYARHGYKFNTKYWLCFFSQYDWYKPMFSIDEMRFSVIEHFNLDEIRKIEYTEQLSEITQGSH